MNEGKLKKETKTKRTTGPKEIKESEESKKSETQSKEVNQIAIDVKVEFRLKFLSMPLTMNIASIIIRSFGMFCNACGLGERFDISELRVTDYDQGRIIQPSPIQVPKNFQA